MAKINRGCKCLIRTENKLKLNQQFIWIYFIFAYEFCVVFFYCMNKRRLFNAPVNRHHNRQRQLQQQPRRRLRRWQRRKTDQFSIVPALAHALPLFLLLSCDDFAINLYANFHMVCSYTILLLIWKLASPAMNISFEFMGWQKVGSSFKHFIDVWLHNGVIDLCILRICHSHTNTHTEPHTTLDELTKSSWPVPIVQSFWVQLGKWFEKVLSRKCIELLPNESDSSTLLLITYDYDV